MSTDESRHKAEEISELPPPYSGTDSLDFTHLSPAPPSDAEPITVVARPREKAASPARKKPGGFPGGAGYIVAVIAIAAVVAFATMGRSSKAPVTPPPSVAPDVPGERMPVTPEPAEAQVPPPEAAAQQPAQKPAWPADFLAALKEYAGKPGSKAMALALDSEGKMAYLGVVGLATQAQANEEALSKCTLLKNQSTLQGNCRLYAVGDEIVW